MTVGIIIFRLLMVAFLAVAGYFFPPFYLRRELGAAVAALLGLVIMVLETRIRRAQFRTIWSSTLGTFAGVIVGWGLGSIYQSITKSADTAVFIRIFFLIIMPYIGFLIGTQKSEWLDPVHFFRFVHEKSAGRAHKILDTSVIIDGRILDICDTAFVEGTLVIPQFVLKELQLVADSADSLKRQRGRRGLDVLDRLQKSAQVPVQISDLDFPDVRDVDSKLIELAKQLEAKIVTNDFNLNKVARLQGIVVLNINELANALKPIVLPGEAMKVFILKEGKEKDQGVAYLDDGTMVVVDNSRRLIGQTIMITVTSVLQTTVGKMIFGRYNEDAK
ncbi:MAG: PIN domain-containing protein [Candidatus Aminicenantes bacterium]|nr:PIN domain-containing protein [Candidatus Aminicenantes bacterium]